MIKVRFLFQQLCAGVRCGAATVRFDAGQRRACARLLSRVGRHGLPRARCPRQSPNAAIACAL